MVNGILGMGYELTQTLANLQRQLTALSTQPILLNASTGQDGGKGLTTDKNGLHVFNPAGAEVARVETTDGALVMFDGAGNEIARYGLLTDTAAGTYGAEVLVSGTWVQLGAQTSTWGTLSGIPGTYNTGNQKWTPDAHAAAHAAAGSDPVSISGSQVTSAVGQANGSQYGFSNPVAGTSFYALWVGNDTGYHFGTNVSTARAQAEHPQAPNLPRTCPRPQAGGLHQARQQRLRRIRAHRRAGRGNPPRNCAVDGRQNTWRSVRPARRRPPGNRPAPTARNRPPKSREHGDPGRAPQGRHPRGPATGGHAPSAPRPGNQSQQPAPAPRAAAPVHHRRGLNHVSGILHRQRRH